MMSLFLVAVSAEAAPTAESEQEDMLEMALRIANELGDPVLDLETTIEPAPLQKGRYRMHPHNEGLHLARVSPKG